MMGKRRGWLSAIGLLVVAAFVVSACGGGGGGTGSSGGTINIGVMGPMSGDYTAAGVDIRDAAKLQVQKINASGGLLGKQINLIPADDACDAQTATQAAQKLISQGVVAVVGGYCSSASIPETKVFHENGNIPYVNGASTNPTLTESGYTNFFRTIGRDDEQGPFAAKFMIEALGAKRIAILHDNTAYAKGLAEETKKTVESSGSAQVVYYDAITPGEKDYTSTLTDIASKSPDVLYFTGYFSEAGILAKEHHDLNLQFALMGGDATNDQTVIDTAGPAADGMYVDTAPIAKFLSAAQDFVKEYKDAYSRDPGPYSVYTYDDLGVLAEAIKNAGSTDAQKIIDALHAIQGYDGLTGTFHFNDKGDRANPVYIVLRIENQQFAGYMELKDGKWVKMGQ